MKKAEVSMQIVLITVTLVILIILIFMAREQLTSAAGPIKELLVK